MTPFGKSIVAVLIVGALTASAYFVSNKNALPVSQDEIAFVEDVTTESTSTQEVTDTPTSPTGKKMAFSQFMKQDKSPYMCDVTQDIDGVSTKGIIYLSNGNIRGEFTNSVSGKTQTSYMVVKDGYSYAWSTFSSSTGVKVKTDSPDGSITIGGARTVADSNWNPETIGDYTCQTFAVEEGIFSLPQNITFAEISR